MNPPPSTFAAREKELFLQALDLEGDAELEQFLSEACRDHPELRSGVEDLLRAHATEEKELLDPASYDTLQQERERLSHQLEDEAGFLEALGRSIDSVGDYDLIEEIGRGAMGVVFRARQRSLDRVVAIKIILGSALGSETERERFRVEAAAAAHLDHPNIVPIYEFGSHENCDYYSMPLLTGGTLGERVQDSSLDQRQAVALISTVAKAAQSAHQHGIIHRDLKPDNILLDDNGVPYISDFGLACRLEQKSTLTLSGQIMGTPQYMAPEQADASSEQVTTAVDVYSLGAILYELLSGVPVFRGKSILSTLQMVRETPPRTLRAHDPSIDRDLETVVLKALEKDPARRYHSARALALDLDAWLDHRPISARAPSLPERVFGWIRRRPVHAALIGTALLLLLTLGIGGPIAAYRQSILATEATSARTEADHARLEAVAAQQLAQDRSEQNRSLLYHSQMNQLGMATTEPGMFPVMQILLNKWRPRPRQQDSDLRDWEWYYLSSFSMQADFTLKGPESAAVVAMDPGGARCAVANKAGGLVILDATSGNQLIDLGGHQAGVRDLAWNTEGSLLASASADGILAVWDAESGEKVNQINAHSRGALSVGWSPDGQILYSSGGDKALRSWNSRTGQPGKIAFKNIRQTGIPGKVRVNPSGDALAWISQPSQKRVEVRLLTLGNTGAVPTKAIAHQNAILDLAWNPDGSLLATCSRDESIVLWKPVNGELKAIRALKGHTAPVKVLAWSPDGTRLVTGAGNRELKIWDVASGLVIDELPGQTSPIQDLDWSANGSRIVVVGVDGRITYWRADRRRLPEPLLVHDAGFVSVAFSPDGSKIACTAADSRVFVLDAETGKPGPELPDMWNDGRSLGWHQDSRRLAIRSNSGQLQVIDTTTGDVIQTIKTGTSSIVGIAWNPEGTQLVTCSYGRQVKIWNPETGAELRTLLDGGGPPLWTATWSPDGKYILCTGGKKRFQLWSATDGKTLVGGIVPNTNEWLIGQAWHPNDERFATSSSDSTVQLWKVGEMRSSKTLIGHTSEVKDLAWHPSGTRIASASSDRTIKIWDPESGELTLTLRAHTGQVQALDWSPDGKKLVSVCRDGQLLLWDASKAYESAAGDQRSAE